MLSPRGGEREGGREGEYNHSKDCRHAFVPRVDTCNYIFAHQQIEARLVIR